MTEYQHTAVSAKNKAEFDMRVKELEKRGYTLEAVQAVEEVEHRFYKYSTHGSRMDRKQSGESDVQQKFQGLMKRPVPDGFRKKKGWGNY